MKQGKILKYNYISARTILEKNSVYDVLGWDKKQALIDLFKSKRNYKTHVVREEKPRKNKSFYFISE